MAIITLAQLIKHDACREQVELFKERFGEFVVVTEELAASVSQNFVFDWAARNLLSDSASDTYQKACNTACAKYRKARDAAQTKYEKVCDVSYAEYEKARAAGEIEYEKVVGPALAKYNKECAVTFARLYCAAN